METNVFDDGRRFNTNCFYLRTAVDGDLRLFALTSGSVIYSATLDDVKWSNGDLIEIVASRDASNNITVNWTNHTTGYTETDTGTTAGDYSGGDELLILSSRQNPAVTGSLYAPSSVTMLYFAAGTTSSNLLLEYVFGEGDGDVTYDRIGGNHLTWSGSLGSLWTQSEHQKPHHNMVGFDRWKNNSTGADLFVPLQTNGTSIQTSGDTLSGYTWQTKVSTGSDKYHNGSEMEIYQPADCPQLYDIDQNDFTTSIWYSAAGVPQAIVRGMLVENYLSADAWLNRLDSLEIQEDNIAALDQWNLSGVTDGNSDRGQLYGVYLHDSDSDYDTSIWLFDDLSGLPGFTPPFNSHLVAYFKTGVNNYTGTATLSEYNDSGISGAVEILTNGGTWAPDEEFTYQMRLETWADWQVGEEEIPPEACFYGGLSLSLSLGA